MCIVHGSHVLSAPSAQRKKVERLKWPPARSRGPRLLVFYEIIFYPLLILRELSPTPIQYPPTTVAFFSNWCTSVTTFTFKSIQIKASWCNSLQQFSFVGVFPHSLISIFSQFRKAPTSHKETSNRSSRKHISSIHRPLLPFLSFWCPSVTAFTFTFSHSKSKQLATIFICGSVPTIIVK